MILTQFYSFKHQKRMQPRKVILNDQINGWKWIGKTISKNDISLAQNLTEYFPFIENNKIIFYP